MKISPINVPVFELILTADEVQWLRDNMQNPLHGQAYTDESDGDSEMRTTLWSTLNSVNLAGAR